MNICLIRILPTDIKIASFNEKGSNLCVYGIVAESLNRVRHMQRTLILRDAGQANAACAQMNRQYRTQRPALRFNSPCLEGISQRLHLFPCFIVGHNGLFESRRQAVQELSALVISAAGNAGGYDGAIRTAQDRPYVEYGGNGHLQAANSAAAAQRSNVFHSKTVPTRRRISRRA